MPRRVLLTPVGSHGDVLPFLHLGRTLAARGHEVVLISAAPFAPLAERAGLGFRSTATAEEYEAMTRHPNLWDVNEGLRHVMSLMGERARVVHDALVDLYRPGHTVVVGHTIAWGARLFEERTGAPSLTVHLAPTGIRTAHDVVISPGRTLDRWPVFVRRLAMWGVDRFMVDRHAAPGLNAVRRELGLPPVPRPIRAWLNSPQGVLGLFPDWFGAPQPDWPPRVQLVGFPLPEEDDADPRSPEPLTRFLDDGPPPVVVTPGSANRQARPLIEAALAACARLGRRALVLTRYAEQVPALPAGAHHAEWAPLARVLPRAAALIHHGGVGTSAEGLAGGVPQLVVPFAFDQPDNATRLARLGVGRWAQLARPGQVEAQLTALLDDPNVPARCAHWRAQIDRAGAIARAADAVEAVPL